VRAIACSAWLAAPLAGAAWAEPPVPAQDPGRFDWCAPVVSRPLLRFSDRAACVPRWTPGELAAGVDVVMLGGSEVGEEEDTAGEPCAGSLDTERYAGFVKQLKAAAAERGRSPVVVVSTRFDLVGPELAARPGFAPAFLLRSGRPYRQVVDFFEKDASPDCHAGCRFASARRRHGPDDQDRIAARVDALAGAGASDSVVWYLVRSSPGQTVFRATTAVADLGNPDYRAFRVAEARRALAELGADAVYLGHKLHQYRRGANHYVASAAAPDVTALNQLRDTLWSAPPKDYGYTDYVRGWRDLARDLRAGGVPYAVLLPSALFAGGRYDDLRSLFDDEAEWLREAAEGARVVLLDRSPRVSAARADAIRQKLSAAGAQVVPIDTRCPMPDTRRQATLPPRPAPGR
jgi:hypothetical protein